MDKKALFKLGYGLYVLSAKEGEKDSGCIVNTVMQVTDEPLRIVAVVNKANYTNGMVARTGKFCVSVLSEKVTFDTIKRFGFQSGKDVSKFDGIEKQDYCGLPALASEECNAVIACKVLQTVDLPTHTMFIAEVVDAEVKSDTPTCTYTYYQENVKPKPEAKKEEQAKWRCTVCGYVYDGDTLPEDFICPWCKHPASDFEKV